MALLRSFPDRSGPEYDDKRKESVNGTCRVTNIRCTLPVISSGDRGRQQRSAVKSDRVPLVDVGNRDYAVYPNARYDEEKFRTRKKWNIEDKINELKSNPDKSPIAILKEIMLLKRKPIDFDLVSMSGQVHVPEFKYHAKTDDMIAFGRGSSKKEAKKKAALEFLLMLDRGNSNDAITSTTINPSLSPISEDHAKTVLDVKSELNPIGALQELCMARKWALPEYEFKTSFNGIYVVVCSFNIYISKGEAKTKQGAKTQAARFMYEQVKDIPYETIFDNANSNPTPGEVSLNSNNSDYSSMNLVNCDQSNVLQYMEIFFENLKTSTKPFINNLRRYDSILHFKMSNVDILNKICEEEGFNALYTTMSKKIEILVQVSICPFLVNIGTGKTVEEAYEAAAHATLLHLKLMLGS